MLLWLRSYIKQHLLWQITLPIFGVFIVVCVLGIIQIYSFLYEDLKKNLLARGQLAAHSIQYAVESASTMGSIQRYTASIGAEDDIDFVAVIINGDPPYIISSTELKHIGKPVDTLVNVKHKDDLIKTLNVRTSQYDFDDLNDEVFHYTTPALISNITLNGNPLGKGAIMLHLNTLQPFVSMKNKLIIISSSFVVMMFLLVIFLLVLLQYHILAPQKKLLRTIQERLDGNKNLAIIYGENEFSKLSLEFNKMLNEIDKVETIKSDFISTVSHELRTPLTSIKGAIGLLSGGNAKDSQNVLFDVANRNCERLSILINDLLDVEKIISGTLQFDVDIVDLKTVVDKSVQDNSTYAVGNSVHVTLTESPEKAIVLGDESRLMQVLSNLLSNAIKFSSNDSVVEVSIVELNNNYRVCVKDYGRGIPDEFRSIAFQRFAQVDSSDTKDRGGTGLGLNICKMIIELHNGTINYNSTLNVGTEFFFDIPQNG